MVDSATRRVNFTKAVISALEPAAKLYDVADTKQQGLFVRVRPTGSKKFLVYRKVEGIPQRLMIGSFPEVTVEQARDFTAMTLGKIAMGENPFDERAALRQEMSVGTLFARYLENYSKPRKRTWKRDEKLYDLHLKPKWDSKKVSKLTRLEIQERHEAIGKSTPIQANRVLSLVSKMMAYAQKIGVGPDSNPCRGIEKFPEAERQRYLNNDEMKRFFAALDAEPNQIACDYFRLSLFLGARRSNMLAMRWEELHFETCEWRIRRTKTGRPLVVHLSREALIVLEARKLQAAADHSPWVFPSYGATGHLVEPKKVWKRICDAAKLEDFRIHDLRHSYASYLANGGASLLVLQKALGHLTLASTKRYTHLVLDTVRPMVDDAVSRMAAAAGINHKRVVPTQPAANNTEWDDDAPDGIG